MRVYVAGPMTGLPEFNYPAFHAAAASLDASGYTPVNPATTGQHEGWGWHQYMRAGLTLLLTCDGVALLPGWAESRGARVERMLALELGMAVRPLGEWLDDRSDCCGGGCPGCPGGGDDA